MIGNVLYDWQTLTAGILAIVGALIGGGAVWRQSNLVERREQRRLDRQHAAARAVLPLALSALVDYANDCASGLRPFLDQALAVSVLTHASATQYAPPLLDPTVITGLRDVVESADAVVGERISAAISDVQILTARLRSVARSRGSDMLITKSNIETYIVGAATVYARGEDLFSYARRETDQPPPLALTEKRLHTALRLMGFDESVHLSLFATALRHVPVPKGT